MADIDTHVQHGIALLDAHSPGWRARVDLARLDMESSTDGLLEQLYGTFHDGRIALGLTWNSDETGCAENGFDIAGGPDALPGVVGKRRWQALTEAWKRALSEQ